jgi:hypothetical protein
MANTIRIKRSTGSAAPTSLANAELAFTEGTDILYYGEGTGGAGGTATTIQAIGGLGAFVSLGSTAQTIAGVKTFTGATVLGTPGSGTLTNCTSLPLTTGVTGVLGIANGGTGFSTLAATGFALKGANADITSITGLTTPLTVAQGGTGSASGVSLTASVSGILPIANGGTGSSSGVALATAVSGVLPLANGGTGASTLAGAGIALRGANSDITSLTGLTTALSVGQGGTGVTTSTGTGSVVLSATPTFTGTLNCAALSSTGNVIVGGNLTVNGTTTTVNSTTVTLDDPIITLGGDTAPASDDSKDRGVEFRWHNGTSAKLGFFGFDDSTGYLTFIPDATNTTEVFSGTMGDIQATNFRGALIGNASTVTNGLYTDSTIDGGSY